VNDRDRPGGAASEHATRRLSARAIPAQTLSGYTCPEPEATAIAESNLAAYKQAGCKVRRNWDARAPYVERIEGGHGAYVIGGGGLHRRFLDHLYRIVTRGGKKIYVAEPYGIDGEGLAELAELDRGGWYVQIGQTPLWYPGRTTPILMERRP
jgi:hypothetical protein